MQLTYKFDDPDNFDFDIKKIDFSGGAIWDNDYKKNRIFAAKFKDDFNARDKNNNIITYSKLQGDIELAYNRAYFKNYNSNLLEFKGSDFDLNTTVNKGTISFFYIPNYDQYPSQPIVLFRIGPDNQSRTNEININHWNNGTLSITFFDKNGSQAPSTSSIWAPSQNREYHFELCWNFDDPTNSFIKLFINGTLFLENTYYIERESSPIDTLKIGNGYNDEYRTNCFIRNFAIFSEVRHSSNFEYSAKDAEYFSITGASLKKTADYSFLVNFKNHDSDDFDADFALGNKAGTPYGGIGINNGVLDLTFSDDRYVSYSPLDNISFLSEGAIRIGIIPNYSGYPTSDMFYLSVKHSGSGNWFYLRHYKGGQLYLIFANNSNHYESVYFGNFSPIAGQLYHLEFDFSYIQLRYATYLDGILKQRRDFTWTNFRANTNLTEVRLGGGLNNNFSIAYFHICNSILRDFERVDSFTDYDKTNEMAYPAQEAYYIEPKTKILTDGLEAVGGEVIDTQGGDRHYIVIRDNDKFYWNGTNWAISDGTWAQSNDPLTMINNLHALDLTAGFNCTFRILLKSVNGNETDTIKTIEINYNFYGGDAISSQLCTVYGYLYDPTDKPISNAKITVELLKEGFNENKLIADQVQLKLYTNQYGYFELGLIPNSDISPRSRYKFTFRKGRFYKEDILTVPTGIPTINYKDLRR